MTQSILKGTFWIARTCFTFPVGWVIYIDDFVDIRIENVLFLM